MAKYIVLRLRRFALPPAALAGAALLMASPAQASVQGQCAAVGLASRASGSAQQIIDRARTADPSVASTDLTLVDVWRVGQNDRLVVVANSAQVQHRESAALTLFGLPVGLLSAASTGNSVSTGPWTMGRLSPFLRRVGITAQTDTCAGSTVLESDRPAVLTAGGAGGLVLLLLGLLGMLIVALRPAAQGRRSRVVAGSLAVAGGLVAGVGAGLWLQEAGWLSPLSTSTLAVPVLGLLLGVAAAALPRLREAGRLPERVRLDLPERRQAPVAAALALAVTGLALGLGSLPAGGSQSSGLAGKTEARQVVLDTWQVAKQVRSNQDMQLASSVFIGQAYGYVADRAAAPAQATEANALTRDLRIDQLLIPHKSGYPADFLVTGTVDVSVSGQAPRKLAVLMLFVKNGPGETWRCPILYADYTTKASFPKLATDQLGYAVVPSGGRWALPLAQAASSYVGYINRGMATGAAPAGTAFAVGANTSGFITSLKQQIQDRKKQNVHLTPSFGSPVSLRAYQLADGGALVIATFDIVDRFTPATPGTTLTYSGRQGLQEIDVSGSGMAMVDVPRPGTAAAQVQVPALDIRLTQTQTY